MELNKASLPLSDIYIYNIYIYIIFIAIKGSGKRMVMGFGWIWGHSSDKSSDNPGGKTVFLGSARSSFRCQTCPLFSNNRQFEIPNIYRKRRKPFFTF